MLNYVNQKIPNNLGNLLKERCLTQADAVRLSGLTRPTVKRLVEGEDSYISKMAILCDSLGILMSDVYGKMGDIHQEAHSHDHSTANNIGYQIVSSVKENDSLKQRIKDLENLVEAKETLLKTQEKLLKIYEEKLGD